VKRVAQLLLVASLVVAGAVRAQTPARFDHTKHRKLFPTCTICHAGAVQENAAIWPDPGSCGSCHDGVIQKRVEWSPPGPRVTNLRFDHLLHQRAVIARPAATGLSPPRCMDCHAEVGAEWMNLHPPVVTRCLVCHGVQTAHLAAPDSACATCHMPLAQATRLTRVAIAAIDTPPSHRAPDFAAAAGHGALSKAPGGGVAASCATCHARDFCLTCHVDAPEQPVITALERDPRATAIQVTLAAPESHRAATFLARHGGQVRTDARRCMTCHTQESCLACHAATPRVANAMPRRSNERGIGAVVTRHPPPSHTVSFASEHAAVAAATPASCAGCHARVECLDCHRPTAARGAGYHPAGFLTRHPAAAYARESSCSDCHNTGNFCVACHAAAGLRATAPLGSAGFHDAKRFFGLGHGQAARQSLESCTGCHVERDCLTCHSATGARRFNPHGPGFDAARLKRKNPQMCIACHGFNIPQ
jgi:hypothetical protein